MAIFSKRHPGYKAGLLVFLLGVAAFVAGFATPHWLKFDVQTSPLAANSTRHQKGLELQGHTGLWAFCVKAVGWDFNCQDVDSSTDWVLAVKVVDCAAMGVMALSACFCIFINCLAQKPAFTRLLEIGTGISGLLGIIGAAIYMWKSHTDKDFQLRLQDYDIDLTLSWSYHINVGGSVVILVATVLISIYNQPFSHKRATTTKPTNPLFTSFSGTTLAQGCSGSGSNPYIVSDAMAGRTPALYPNLQSLGEGVDKPATVYVPTTEMRY